MTNRALSISFQRSAVVWILGVLALSKLIIPGDALAEDPYAAERERLVRTRIETAGVTDSRILDSIRTTLRHEFIPKAERKRSYFDMALPIGSSQTISSPFIVALMTEALQPENTDKVLEIGTGSGYQAAVLSPLVQHVYTIEIVPELGEKAAETLGRLGYENVSTRIGDGFLGWPDAAPFDKIILTCSPESVPEPLIEQLREGGQMVIPVGERYQQSLNRMTKKNGKLEREVLRPTLFVPMTGAAEEKRELLPDGSIPEVVNGNFDTIPQGEEANIKDFVPGWYYGRQVQQVAGNSSDPAPQGKFYVRFENETPGLNSHLLQGIAIDGREVSSVVLSGKARTFDIRKGPTQEAMPMIAISLYDELRRDLGHFWVGPFRGTRSWREASRMLRIPVDTREAILRVGLFGATGRVDFDEIELNPVD